MDKKIWLLLGVVVIVLGAVIYFGKAKGDPNVVSAAQADLFDTAKIINQTTLPTDFNNNGQTPATTANNVFDNYAGNLNAKVTLVEYGDLACSHCALYAPILKTAREKYADQIIFVFRYFVLGNQGANGLAAATANEAAARQGKFWEMNELLYTNQSEWFYANATERKDWFRQYAEQLRLDVGQWSRDYDDYKTNGIKTKIDFGHALGERVDLSGTPTLVINGHKLDAKADPSDDWTSQEKLDAIIEKYLAG